MVDLVQLVSLFKVIRTEWFLPGDQFPTSLPHHKRSEKAHPNGGETRLWDPASNPAPL